MANCVIALANPHCCKSHWFDSGGGSSVRHVSHFCQRIQRFMPRSHHCPSERREWVLTRNSEL